MSDFYPEGKKIKIAGIELTIMPFVLRVRNKVLKVFVEILVELTKVNPNLKASEIKPSDLAKIAPAMIEAAGDKIITIYEIALGKDREWLENNVTLKNEIEIIQAIMEINDIPFLLQQARKMISSAKQKT